MIYGALMSCQVDVICAYSSAGRIPANKLVVLDDDRSALPKYDAILLLSRKGSENAALKAALMPLVEARCTQETIEAANHRVDVDGESPRKAAKELLATLAKGR